MHRVRKQVEISAPVGIVFDLFGRFDNFPLWMQGILSVERYAPGRTRWIAEAPDGSEFEWEAEVTNLDSDLRITWRSVDGDIAAEGDARFEATARGTTSLHLMLGYGTRPLAQDESVAEMFASNLEQDLEDDLMRFKLFAEQEAQTVNGQGLNAVIAAPAMPAGAMPRTVSDQSEVHFEPLSDIFHSGQVIRPALPLGRRDHDYSETPDTPQTVYSRTDVDADEPDESHLDGYEQYSITPGTRPASRSARSGQPVFNAFILVFLLALAVGAGWFLASMRSSNLDDRRAAEPMPSPANSAQPSTATANQTTPAPVITVTPLPVETPGQAPSDAEAESGGADAEAREAVKSALDDWIAATNEKDIDAQMNFYAPVMRRYYLQSNVPLDAVREDKTERFAQVDSVRMSAGEPEITLEQDGRAARVRFRKQYEIVGGGGTQSGEVIQELLFAKRGNEWRIVSERDLRVIK